MNTRRTQIAVLVWVALVVLVGARIAHATEFASGPEVAVPQERVINDDLFIAGNRVTMQGEVKGDVYAAGANVTISGPVQEDVVAAGANVSLTGTIGDDVRAAGAEVIVSSAIRSDALLSGKRVILRPGATVGQDLHIGAQEALLQGKVGRNLFLSANSAQIGGEVSGPVVAHVARLTVLPGAVIHGDLTVYGPNPPEVSPQAQVQGSVIHRQEEGQNPRGGFVNWLTGWLISFLMVLVLGATIIAISPIWPERVAATIIQQVGITTLTGFVGVFLTPIVSFLLMGTIIGIPLGLLLLMVYGTGLLLSSAFVSYLLGDWLVRRLGSGTPSRYAQLTLGTLLLTLLMSLPWLGGLILCLTLILGFGALALERRDYRNRVRAEGRA